MSLTGATTLQRFVRRTALQTDEYRTNFRQIDCDVIATLTSPEASKVTSHMSKIYLALINLSSDYWERQGILRFAGCEREGKWQTAWEQLTSLIGVASATARKALTWMHKQGVIGYYAGRNGVGIRIFINRAVSSIAQKPRQHQKNLHLVQASKDSSHTSPNDMPFNEDNLDNLDLDLNPRAPENSAPDTGAETEEQIFEQTLSTPDAHPPVITQATSSRPSEKHTTKVTDSAAIIAQVVREIVPQVKAIMAREHEFIREWFITHALPKAIRVSQRSAYDVLRAHGVITESRSRSSGNVRGPFRDRDVGKHISSETNTRRLTGEEINELAESCVALLLIQDQPIDHTISEMTVEAGGFLLAEDVPKIRASAEALINSRINSSETNQNQGGENNAY